MRRPSRRQWAVFVVLVILLVAGTTMPGALKSDIEHRMWHVLPWAHLAHFVLFFAIAACPVYGEGRAAFARAFALALFLAILTEWLQRFVPGRHPTLRDVLIDLGGMLAGFASGPFFRRTRDMRTAEPDGPGRGRDAF